MKQKQAKNILTCYFFSDDDSDGAVTENESEGEDNEDLEGVFDPVPLDNSDLIPPDNPEDLPFSPVTDTPPSTTVTVDVHASADLDSNRDSTLTGWHVSLVRFFTCYLDLLFQLLYTLYVDKFCLNKNAIMYI